MSEQSTSDIKRRLCESDGCERAAVYRAYVGVQDGSEDEKIVCGTHSDELERGPEHTLLEELSAPERYVGTDTQHDGGDAR
jgi:hypothetical protein